MSCASCVATDLSGRQPPNSPRPPLARCSEAELLDDVCAFLTVKRGKKLARAAFPDAQVGGSRLDLFTLYKEVVSRGGYKCADVPGLPGLLIAPSKRVGDDRGAEYEDLRASSAPNCRSRKGVCHACLLGPCLRSSVVRLGHKRGVCWNCVGVTHHRLI